MSRKKKTIEELVQESLVPQAEQPYKIPKNWVWVRMGEALQINPSKPKLDLPNEQICSFLPMSMVNPETGKIDKLEEREFKRVKKGYTYFEENDVLFAKITPCMENGNTVIAKGLKNEFGFGSTEFYIFRNSEHIDERYIYYLLRSEKFRKQAKMKMTGAVGQQRVPKKYLEMYPLALPPLNEQKRIAEKVECLLIKIEEAKQLIEEAKETFELRRTGFLEKVFKFEYHCLYQKDVNNIKTNEIFDFVTSGSRGWAKYYSDSGDIFIRVGNLKHDSISLQLDEIQYVCLPENIEGKRTEVQAGDILVSITADIGRIAIIEEGMQKAYINQHIALARPHKHFYSPYIGWYLAAKTGGKQQMMELQRGATKVGLGLNDIKEITIPVPTYEQQKEIAEFIEKNLKVFNKSEWLLEVCLKQCNELKQSILQKAFKGELGTIDSNDETAIELLKSILQEKL